MIVDPRTTSITVHDASGVRVLQPGDTFAHDAMPGFTIDVAALFERARR